jgi:hypothetical protein
MFMGADVLLSNRTVLIPEKQVRTGNNILLNLLANSSIMLMTDIPLIDDSSLLLQAQTKIRHELGLPREQITSVATATTNIGINMPLAMSSFGAQGGNLSVGYIGQVRNGYKVIPVARAMRDPEANIELPERYFFLPDGTKFQAPVVENYADISPENYEATQQLPQMDCKEFYVNN